MSTPGFAYFSSAGSALLQTGAGSAVATSYGVPGVNGTVKLFDGLDSSGTLIGTINANVGIDLEYSYQFTVGLYVQVVGDPNVTISFY